MRGGEKEDRRISFLEYFVGLFVVLVKVSGFTRRFRERSIRFMEYRVYLFKEMGFRIVKVLS